MESTAAGALVLGIIMGVALGAGLGWLFARQRSARALTELRARAERAEGQFELVASERERLLADRQQAGSLDDKLQPLKESLDEVRRQAESAALARARADAELQEQIRSVQSGYNTLEQATRQLVSAMTSSQSRGQWGEMQLEQLLEHSGLVEGVHFSRQQAMRHATGGGRPDITIHMPGGGTLLIDAKFPFDAYWQGIQAGDSPEAAQYFAKHAADLLGHAKALNSRNYSDAATSPNFVILFLPLESLLSAALAHDGLLLERTFDQKVILATPTSLLGMLRTIAFGYQRSQLADNAEQIRATGAEMLTRLGTALEHLANVGKGLGSAVKNYNEFVGSMERRVLVTARKLGELGVDSPKSLEAPPEITEAPRDRT